MLLNGFKSDFIFTSNIPNFSEMMSQILFFITVYDTLFYIAHHILHFPWFYKHIHKKHHEFKVTISVAAEYAHPFEYIFGNALPFTIGPLLYGQHNVHILTWFTWLFIGTIYTADAHSGYDFPFSPFTLIPFGSPSSYHDFHHYKNVGNYSGPTILWDSLLSTNDAFWKNLKKKKTS